MDNILEFFRTFEQYVKDADMLWAFLMPIITLAAIYLLTVAGMQFIVKTGRLKTVFMIHRALIISSLFVEMILVAIICYCWSKNIFAETYLELAFIISLFLTFIVPIVSLTMLRQYWHKTRVNEITNQPISAKQAQDNIPFINKAFNKNKIWYLLPLFGFLFLLFSLNSGKNLISFVFDKSGTMEEKYEDAKNALNQTFEKLSLNNEIVISTLNGLTENWALNSGMTTKELMTIKSSSRLKIGRNYVFNDPIEAKNNLDGILNSGETVYGSPICEAIWKMWLFTKESKGNADYKNKLLIVFTDGDENYSKEINKFFYEDTEFAEFYTPDNTHIVDYSENGNGVVIKKFEDNGAIIYPAVTSVDDYLSALDDALLSFQKNIFLIIWTIVIVALGTIIGLVITPKKISI